jgi:hypothetical protein
MIGLPSVEFQKAPDKDVQGLLFFSYPFLLERQNP